MDGVNRGSWTRGAAALAVTLALSGNPVMAQAPAAGGPPAVNELAAVLKRTKAQGVPVVVVATSASRPDTKAFWQRFAESPWVRSHRGLVQVVEFPVESSPGLTETMKIRATPTVLAYVAGPDGPTCVGTKTGGLPEDAIAWLGTLPLGDGRPRTDPAVAQAGYDGGYPTPQAPYYPQMAAPQPQAPPVASYPVMAQQPQMQMQVQAQAPAPSMMMMAQPVQQPMMMAQPVAPSQVVQVPGPNVVVQQGEARVFLAQQPSPSMTFAPQVASPSPNMFMTNVAAPAPAQQPMVAFSQAPAQQPMMAFAPSPAQQPMMAVSAPAPQPAVAFASAPAPTPSVAVAAVTNQTVGLPTSGSRTRVRVRGPGPIRSGLASFGERLTQLGRSRIETIQETDLNTPSIQGGGGVATLSTSTATPLGPQQQQSILSMPQQPQQQVFAAPQPPPQPQSQPEVEYGPAPSPQGVPHKHGHFQKR